MLPVQRVTIGQLWTLLNEERAGSKESRHPFGYINGHVGSSPSKKATKTKEKDKGPNGYWWSR